MGREVARRGLYSRFYRSAPAFQPTEEVEAVIESIAGPSTVIFSEEAIVAEDVKLSIGLKGGVMSSKRGRIGKEGNDETKEERQARRADRARRKLQKGSTGRPGSGLPEGVKRPMIEKMRGSSKRKSKNGVALVMGPPRNVGGTAEAEHAEASGVEIDLAAKGKRKKRRRHEQLVV